MENSGNEFDLYCSNELREPILFKKIVKSNIGWFSDKSICDHHVNYWGLENKYGLYILWHKSDYNPDSGLFHMKALYIGKGNIGARLRSHWKNKDFSDELLIYFTYVELPNRVSKYVDNYFLISINYHLIRPKIQVLKSFLSTLLNVKLTKKSNNHIN